MFGLCPWASLEEFATNDQSADIYSIIFSVPNFGYVIELFHQLAVDGPSATHNILITTYQELSKLWKFSQEELELSFTNIFYLLSQCVTSSNVQKVVLNSSL